VPLPVLKPPHGFALAPLKVVLLLVLAAYRLPAVVAYPGYVPVEQKNIIILVQEASYKSGSSSYTPSTTYRWGRPRGGVLGSKGSTYLLVASFLDLFLGFIILVTAFSCVPFLVICAFFKI
jgi:hypothetical protein